MKNPRAIQQTANLAAKILLMISTLALLIAAPLQAAEPAAPGRISGVVSNKNTGQVLQDARVDIPSLRISANTDELGRYSFLDIPAGNYVMQVTYMGLDQQNVQVQVGPGQHVTKNVDLTADVYLLEKYTVTTEREGQAAAISRQKAADNIKNVLAMDAFGVLPNDNVGELLIQVPGIVGDLDDEGNITEISVRGMGAATTAFSVDGNTLSSTGSDRTFNTRDISAVLFDEIEIIKAPAPEHDGNSLGGSVNMKTLSTLRNKRRAIVYKITGVWAPSFADQIPLVTKNQALSGKFNLTYKDIFSIFGGKNNLGLSVNLSYDESFKGYFSNSYDYERTLKSPAFIWRYIATDYYSKRVKESANIRLDLRLSRSVTAYASLIFANARQPDDEQYKMSLQGALNGDDGAIYDVNGVPTFIPYNIIVPGYTKDYTAYQLSDAVLPDAGDRVRYPRPQALSNLTSNISRMRSFNFGVVHDYSRLKIDYDFNYNYNHINYFDGHDGDDYGGNVTIRKYGAHTWSIDKSKSISQPTIISTNPDYPLDDIASYDNVLTYVKQNGKTLENSAMNGSVNARYILPFNFASTVKFGGRYRQQKMNAHNGARQFGLNQNNPDVSSGRLIRSFLNPSVDITAQYAENAMRMPFVDVARVGRDLAEHPEHWIEDMERRIYNYHAGKKDMAEDVIAGYVQGTAVFGKFSFLGGIRFERTEDDAFAYLQTMNTTGSANWIVANPKYITKSYDNWFPSLHMKYTILPNLLLRASWSNTIGRPKFGDILPSHAYSQVSNEGRVYNPNLKPQTSMNWDLSLEYYFKQIGQFSVGLFRKDVADFLTSTRVDEDQIPPEYQNNPEVMPGAIFQMPLNGQNATIDGIEISYQQNLTFLPGILSGLSVYANYTHLEVSGNYGSYGDSTNEIQGFVPDVANLTLTWKINRLTASVSTNYTGRKLSTYAPRKYDLIYKDDRINVNFRMLYKLARSVTLSCDIINLTEEPQRYYYFTKERPRSYSNYGMTVIFGISGQF